jgi:Zn ribbon nucleic-acid-binding protein
MEEDKFGGRLKNKTTHIDALAQWYMENSFTIECLTCGYSTVACPGQLGRCHQCGTHNWLRVD